jgi:mono/diheme cytochrome c family protein
MEQENAKKPWDEWKWRLLALVPVVALVCGIILSINNLRFATLRWDGVILTEPIKSDKVFQEVDCVVYVAESSTDVLAAASGKIFVQDGVVEIRNERFTVRYLGLTFVNAVSNQSVSRGQVIGKIAATLNEMELSLQLIRNGEPVPPPQALPHVSPGGIVHGERVFRAVCAGCHSLRDIIPLTDGRLMDGELATAEVLVSRVRSGGDPMATAYAMPAFSEAVLPSPELKAVTAYMLSAAGGQKAPVH